MLHGQGDHPGHIEGGLHLRRLVNLGLPGRQAQHAQQASIHQQRQVEHRQHAGGQQSLPANEGWQTGQIVGQPGLAGFKSGQARPFSGQVV